MQPTSQGAIIAVGTYTGNGAANRAIAHGMSVAPKLILIIDSTGLFWFRIISGLAKIQMTSSAAGWDQATVTAPTSTNFYLGPNGVQNISANINATVYFWAAIG